MEWWWCWGEGGVGMETGRDKHQCRETYGMVASQTLEIEPSTKAQSNPRPFSPWAGTLSTEANWLGLYAFLSMKNKNVN